MNITEINSYTKRISINTVKIKKAGIFLCGMETPLQWYQKQKDKPTVVCNCGLFSGNAPVFTLKINSKILIKDSLYRGLGINGTQFRIGNIDEIPSQDFVSGAPVLTYDGKNQVTQAWVETLQSIAGYEPRTVFGFDDENAYILSIDGRQTTKPGATLEMLPKICLDAGLKNAVNFDGGYSSMIVSDGKILNQGAKYRGVYTVFAIWEVNMEFKRPDFTNVKTAYVRADSNGVIQDLNNVYIWAEMTAKAKGHAIWETSTKTLIYPKNAEVKPPVTLVQTGESDFLNELKDMIERRLSEI